MLKQFVASFVVAIMLAGAAMAEPIVFLGSLHNLDYAEVAAKPQFRTRRGTPGLPTKRNPTGSKTS